MNTIRRSNSQLPSSKLADESCIYLLDEKLRDVESASKKTLLDRYTLHFRNARRIIEIQLASLHYRQKLGVYTVLLLLCLICFTRINPYSTHVSTHVRKQLVWDDFSNILDGVDPGVPSPKMVDEATWPARYTAEMPEEDVAALKQSHENFLQQSSDLTLKGLYNPGTTGIVSTAGGRYLNVFLVSLRCLRRTGSNLPVELFLEVDSEYDEYFCEQLLPSLNARCKVMSHLVGTRLATNLQAFQIKTFAIMSSSFENVLFLDADNLALLNPEIIFSTTIYETMGLILWPDFLKTSESSILGDVQGPLAAKWTGSANISMESGQIFISKAIHERTLLLASYYNYYGPSYYYPLFTQGGNGEGDKETFAAAAAYLRNPYYLVEEMVQGFGFFDSNSSDIVKDMEHFKNVGMIQFIPNAPGPQGALQALFLHWNWPKLDAAQFLDEEHLLQDHTAVQHRVWEYARGPGDTFVPWSELSFPTNQRGWGRDSEAIAIEQMVRVACVDLRTRYGMENMCKRLRAHYRSVYSDKAI